MAFRKMTMMLYVLLVCFLIAGCMDMQTTATINSDGSVDYKQQIMTVDMLAKELKKGQDSFQQKHPGCTLRDVSDSNMQGYEATIHYASMDDMVKDEDNLFKRTRGKSTGVQCKKEWLFDIYNIDIVLEGNKAKSGKADEWENFSKAMLSQIKIGLSINLPYKPIMQNADNVSDDGKTLYWNLASALTDSNDKEIKAQFRIWNKTHIGIIAAVSLLLVILFIISIYKLERRGADKNNIKVYVACIAISGFCLAAIGAYSFYSITREQVFDNNDIISPVFIGEPIDQMGKTVFNDEKEKNNNDYGYSSNKSEQHSKNSKTEASLGNIDIGAPLSDVSEIYGTNWKVTTSNNGSVSYMLSGIMEVIVKDNKVIGLVSDSYSVKTKSGLSQGDSLDDVIKIHGNPQLKTDYNGLVLYEYEKESLDNRKCWLRYAIKNGVVDYISVRYKD